MLSLSPKKVLFYWQAQKSRARCPPTALVYLEIMVKGLRATTLRVQILVTT